MDDRMAADFGRVVLAIILLTWVVASASWVASWLIGTRPIDAGVAFAMVTPVAIVIGAAWALTRLVFRLVRAWWRQWSV